MDGAQCGLPGQSVLVSIELQLVGEVLGLLENPDGLHDGEELLLAIVLLLLLQHQYETEAKAGLHYHPVHVPCKLKSGAKNTVSSPVSVRQRTLQFLISHWQLEVVQFIFFISLFIFLFLLSNTCTLASRMLGREVPYGRYRRCIRSCKYSNKDMIPHFPPENIANAERDDVIQVLPLIYNFVSIVRLLHKYTFNLFYHCLFVWDFISLRTEPGSSSSTLALFTYAVILQQAHKSIK